MVTDVKITGIFVPDVWMDKGDSGPDILNGYYNINRKVRNSGYCDMWFKVDTSFSISYNDADMSIQKPFTIRYKSAVTIKTIEDTLIGSYNTAARNIVLTAVNKKIQFVRVQVFTKWANGDEDFIYDCMNNRKVCDWIDQRKYFFANYSTPFEETRKESNYRKQELYEYEVKTTTITPEEVKDIAALYDVGIKDIIESCNDKLYIEGLKEDIEKLIISEEKLREENKRLRLELQLYKEKEKQDTGPMYDECGNLIW